MDGSESRSRAWFRTFAIYAVVGVALTYVSTLFIVALLPITTMSWGCRGVIHRAESGSKPYWRIRVWESPYGTTLQVRRTGADIQAGRAIVEFAKLTPEEQTATNEKYKLRDVEFLPEWSRLRREWPAAIERMEQSPVAWSYTYEIRVGWPFQALGGEYVVTEPGNFEVPVSTVGVAPFARDTAFMGRWATIRQLVAMPLIPQGARFVGSVAFYGLLAFGLVTVLRVVRQWRRRKPGLCRTCGYDRRGSAERCPECGTPFG